MMFYKWLMRYGEVLGKAFWKKKGGGFCNRGRKLNNPWSAAGCFLPVFATPTLCLTGESPHPIYPRFDRTSGVNDGAYQVIFATEPRRVTKRAPELEQRGRGPVSRRIR